MNSNPRRFWRIVHFTLLASVVTLLTACGSSEAKRYPVSGTVNVDDNPLPDGSVKFVSKGDFDSLEVKNGKFSGQVREGKHRVEIYAYREAQDSTASNMYGADAEASKENYLPAKFNTDSTEKKTVTAEGPNEFNFDVSSK